MMHTVHGHFNAARALIGRLQFEQLSLSKSSAILSQAVNVMDAEQVGIVSARYDREVQARILQKESQSYFDMTLLIRAIEALDHWRGVEHQYASKVPRPSSVPSKVRRAFEEIKEAVEQLLGGVLTESKDGKSTVPSHRFRIADRTPTEDEASDFNTIRTLYIPEILLAYNTVLCTAGHMISREELLTSMDLSTVIANDSTGLAKTFVEARRMKELVRSFAETSKIMLKLNETGKPRKEKKKGMGRSLAIWEISG